MSTDPGEDRMGGSRARNSRRVGLWRTRRSLRRPAAAG
jgi:hypothetical protein